MISNAFGLLAPASAAAFAVFIFLMSSWSRADLLRLRRLAERWPRVLDHALNGMRGRLSSRSRSGGSEEARVSLGELSKMIDVIRLGLSAGMSFDGSLELYCAHTDGELARIMYSAELSWRIGAESRESALAGTATRIGERAMESFASVVSQALAMGAPLSQALAQQSAEMRSAHRAAVERQIERAPVKLIIPTGTLILPSLLLSILGPLLASGGMV